MPDGFSAALRLLPPRMQRVAAALEQADRDRAEEFRLRAGRAPAVLLGAEERELPVSAVTGADLRTVMDAATRCSFHAAAEQLRRGYLAAPDGVRVGVCGTAVVEGTVRTFREISSLALRIPRQIVGAGREILPQLRDGSVLILSPPGGGKTTFLRELVRYLSDGGARVGLADERGEIAGAFDGTPRFDVGRHTDVLSAAPRAEAALLLLRAMNPQVIALDEISDPADAEAIAHIAFCGVRILATAHAASPEQFSGKLPVYRRLLEQRVFDRAAVIVNRGGRRSYALQRL